MVAIVEKEPHKPRTDVAEQNLPGFSFSRRTYCRRQDAARKCAAVKPRWMETTDEAP